MELLFESGFGIVGVRTGAYMTVMAGIVLPYEPQYVAHRNEEERRRAVSEWLRQRERELDEHHAPPVVPEPGCSDEKA